MGIEYPPVSKGRRSMARLPYVDPVAANPEVAEALGALPPLKIFSMVANAETAFRPWLGLGAALLGQLQLDARLREMAILEVARLSGSRYEWVQHEAIATALGVGRDEVRAIEQGDVGRLGDAARAVVEFTREVVHEVGAQEATLDAVRVHLATREIVELLLVIGQYMSVARIAATCGIEIDDPAQLAVVEAAAEHGDQA
jgi:alkylhydroperoxidase family enzyme